MCLIIVHEWLRMSVQLIFQSIAPPYMNLSLHSISVQSDSVVFLTGTEAEQSQRERMGGESLQMYQAVHKHIVAITGERNLRKIARDFVENEEKSFAYFSYINELNNKSTMLRDHINRLKVKGG